MKKQIFGYDAGTLYLPDLLPIKSLNWQSGK